MELHSYTSEVMIMSVLNALLQAISRIKSRPEVSDSGQVTQQEQSAHQTARTGAQDCCSAWRTFQSSLKTSVACLQGLIK